MDFHVRRYDGLIPYDAAWADQRTLHADRVAGKITDTIMLLEHEPVYTAGRRTEPHERPAPGSGAPTIDVDRGGKITWHGPGQLVGYPIIRLADPIDVVAYVRRVEQFLIDVCAELGLATTRIEGRSGVWVPADGTGEAANVVGGTGRASGRSRGEAANVIGGAGRASGRSRGEAANVIGGTGRASGRSRGEAANVIGGTGRASGRSRPARKVGAIGIRVAQGVTMHGFALNCDNDLAWFTRIVPCGIADAGVTTLSAELGRPVTVAEVSPIVERHLATIGEPERTLVV
jgi:lipoyl(octanoyl) transferase